MTWGAVGAAAIGAGASIYSSGKSSKAAKDAAKAQAAAAKAGAELTSAMYNSNVDKLNPYERVGWDQLDAYKNIAQEPWDGGTNALRGQVQGESDQWTRGLMQIANTPYDQINGFTDASNAMSRQVQNSAAATGKLNSGNTLNDLFRNNAQIGESMRNNQFNNALNTANFRENTLNSQFTRGFNAETFGENAKNNAFNRYGDIVTMGNNNALAIANMGQGTAANIANLWGGGAASQAAGMMGAQNARNAGTNNLISLGMMAYGGYSGTPNTTAAASSTLQPFSTSQYAGMYK